MKVTILGTRGIPNQYGGYEQLATYLAVGLVKRGHEVVVYNSSTHSERYTTYKGVEMVYRYDPRFLKSASQFIYDLLCILHLRKHRPNVILNLGYTSSSVWKNFFPKGIPLVTHMDGLEWKRSKYSPLVQRFLKKAEKWAVEMSVQHISDNVAITHYLDKVYGLQPIEIAYGAEIKTQKQRNNPSYDLLIARLEPENNIETIIRGVINSRSDCPLKIVGTLNEYGKSLRNKYTHNNIEFLGGIYDQNEVEHLRQNARIYYHGHSVGGTNPSLLEAMATGCTIYAHDNPFNRSVLDENATFFTDYQDLSIKIKQPEKSHWSKWKELNQKKIREIYNWPGIIDQYEDLLVNSIK